MTTEQKIEAAKNQIMVGFSQQFKNESNIIFMNGYNLVLQCKLDCNGFGKQVAETVAKFKNVSGKQAWVIAKTLVESNLTLNLI